MEKIDIEGLVLGAPEDIAPEAPASPQEPRKVLAPGLASIEAIQALTRALEAGGYKTMPSSLVQGCAFDVPDHLYKDIERLRVVGQGLKIEPLDATMKVVTFEDKHLKPFKRIPSPEDQYCFVTMNVVAPSKNVVVADCTYEGKIFVEEDDVVDAYRQSLVELKGERLTVEALEAAARQVDAAFGVPDRVFVPPAVAEEYLRVTVPMSFYSHSRRVTMAGAPVGSLPSLHEAAQAAYVLKQVCNKCARSIKTCMCGDVEETPDLSKASSKVEVDFELVSPDERAKVARAKLDTFGTSTQPGGCYVCAHPKRVAYPHRVTRIPFCGECATRLLA